MGSLREIFSRLSKVTIQRTVQNPKSKIQSPKSDIQNHYPLDNNCFQILLSDTVDKDLSNGYYTVLFLATAITFVKTRLSKCRLCFADEAQQSRNSFPWFSEICPGNMLVSMPTAWLNHRADVTCFQLHDVPFKVFVYNFTVFLIFQNL